MFLRQNSLLTFSIPLAIKLAGLYIIIRLFNVVDNFYSSKNFVNLFTLLPQIFFDLITLIRIRTLLSGLFFILRDDV